MKKHVLAIAFLVLVTTIGKAQDKKPSDFIPEGFVTYEEYYGDVNKDGQEDCILIIQGTNKDNYALNQFDKLVDRNRRGLIVLFKSQNGYQLADKNYDCFYSATEDGGVYYAPEISIDVVRGNLIVNYHHGRYGYWSYVLRYQDSKFKLIGYDHTSSYGPIINTETSINFLTKKKLIRENINQDTEEGGNEIFEDTWYKIHIDKLISLSEIADFNELDMEAY